MDKQQAELSLMKVTDRMGAYATLFFLGLFVWFFGWLAIAPSVADIGKVGVVIAGLLLSMGVWIQSTLTKSI
jgi:hypothetical protein